MANKTVASHSMNFFKRKLTEQPGMVPSQGHSTSRKRTRRESQNQIINTNVRPAVAVIYPEKVERNNRKTSESPAALVKAILGETCQLGKIATGDNESYHSEPTESEMTTYAEMVKAMRAGDLKKLREHLAAGKPLDACNRFGESFIHMACRRGKLDVVSFLIDDAKVRVVRRDDYGRIPLHDAIWTSQPNFDVMDKLLSTVPPSLLLVEDRRGHTCFDYARREHWEAWGKFLNERKSMLQERLEQELSEKAVQAQHEK